MLTQFRFGRNLVAPAITIDQSEGHYGLVTKYINGDIIKNRSEVTDFLQEVTSFFAEIGLSVWQVSPLNPHAYTNLIRSSSNELTIIDLESAVATPFPAKGQFRSSWKNGTIPVFDDIDFWKLRRYVENHHADLEMALGVSQTAKLLETMELGERQLAIWKESEFRFWGKLLRLSYSLLNWKAIFAQFQQILAKADGVAEQFLQEGVSRWESKGFISVEQAEELRTRLSSSETQSALHHLGAHMLLSAAVPIPIPGIRSLVRFGWTFSFLLKSLVGLLRWRSSRGARSAFGIHGPLILGVSLIPLLGAVAYMGARPLRNPLLIRMAVDQAALSLPFWLYRRLSITKWLAPRCSKHNQV